jgi:hypothetical protein
MNPERILGVQSWRVTDFTFIKLGVCDDVGMSESAQNYVQIGLRDSKPLKIYMSAMPLQDFWNAQQDVVHSDMVSQIKSDKPELFRLNDVVYTVTWSWPGQIASIIILPWIISSFYWSIRRPFIRQGIQITLYIGYRRC